MATTVPMEYRMLIDGELVGSDGGTFAVTNPATGEEIATVPNATVEDVVHAIDSAERALVAWRRTTAGERAKILRAAAAGIRAEAQYESASTALGPGDLLLIFTDGLVEAMNQNNDEYGELRLLEALAQKREGGAAERLQYLMNTVDSFVGGARQHDDITCLVLQVEPRAGGS